MMSAFVLAEHGASNPDALAFVQALGDKSDEVL
jgi:hypothetical protein